MLKVEFSSDAIARLLPKIIAIADSNKESLGFLSPSAFDDACRQGRIIAAVDSELDDCVVGYVLFGGLYPNARIYQIGVATTHRRSGVASRLVSFLVSKLEASAYLTLSAKIANDLPVALSFYQSNGFEKVREVPGGAARGRQLAVYARTLQTEDLFSRGDAAESQKAKLALSLRSGRAGSAPFYVIDLNVLFDLIRDRTRSSDARALFGAALAHRVRLVISPEFLVELRRTSFKPSDDAILQMALQLPQLALPDRQEFERTTTIVHDLVFEAPKSPDANKIQSWSDAKHIAHAVVSRASGYITSDGAILAARQALRQQVGIDVASLAELVDLVVEEPRTQVRTHMRGNGFEIVQLTERQAKDYFESKAVSLEALLHCEPYGGPKLVTSAVRQGDTIAAICALYHPETPNSPLKLLLHPNPHVLDSVSYLDALFDRGVEDATTKGPRLIEFTPVSDETLGSITAFAHSRGFIRAKPNDPFVKVALGRPLTPTNWDAISAALRRRTGFGLDVYPRIGPPGDIQLEFPTGATLRVPRAELEDLLSPAIISWSDRPAVIQPIARKYADDLLGSGHQHSLLESKDASFLSRRSYVGSPRSANSCNREA